MKTWIIIGATSAIGEAFARKCAAEGSALLITARRVTSLKAMAEDLRIRGAASVETVSLDLSKQDSINNFINLISLTSGELSVGFFAGSMTDQSWLNEHPARTAETFINNLAGPAECLQGMAPILEAREGGTIIALSSVAGDRGRASNYIYGAAKAGWTTFLSGLRNRLASSGVHVMTVKPGFVDTDMTWGLSGLFLVANPKDVAEHLWRSAKKRKNVIYTPSFWWGIMMIIRHIPEPIFKKLKL